MEEKSVYAVPNNDNTDVVSRTLREVPPADYTFKIESFSLLSDMIEKRYESGDFDSGGYTWKLCLYPNGDEKKNGKGHISLYLVISDEDTLPLGWEVNVNFKLFVFDQIRDKYLTIQDADGRVRRFHRLKTELGFAKLLSLNTFNDASNGYIVDDSCVFGAEVYVIKSTGRGECFSMIKEPPNNTYTWEIYCFSEMKDGQNFSEVFTIGKHNWQLLIFPKGHLSGKGKSLAVFLACKTLPSKRKLYVEFQLQIRDQLQGEHRQSKTSCWFCSSTKDDWGFTNVISLTELHDKSKGFIKDDKLFVELEIYALSSVQHFSEKQLC